MQVKNTFVFDGKILCSSDFARQINLVTPSQPLKSMKIQYDPIINSLSLHSKLSISWFVKSPDSKNVGTQMSKEYEL
jgi:hypothetical protein